MTTLLAEVSKPSAEFLGLVVTCLILLSRWLWDYNKNRREEAQQHEPRATPALHLVYATRDQHKELAERVDAELGRERSSRKKMHEEIAAVQTALARVESQNASQSKEIEALGEAVEETNRRVDTVPTRTIQLLRDTKEYHAT